MTINIIKAIAKDKVDSDVHNAFTRYSIGVFDKEEMLIKFSKTASTVYTGFEHLNFLQRFFANNLTGDIEISGVIESVRDQTAFLKKFNLEFEEKRRFGKSGMKYVLAKQTLAAKDYAKIVEESFGEFLLIDVQQNKNKLKVKKKTTPKLGKPTDKFITLKLEADLFQKFLSEFLYDVKETTFKKASLKHTYKVDNINLDEKLLMQDAAKARKQATRDGSITRTIVVDEKEVVNTSIDFKKL